MPDDPRPTAAFARPWWLDGDEQCEHCLQRYVYEHRFHCARCDGAVCRECVVTITATREVVCPRCAHSDREA